VVLVALDKTVSTRDQWQQAVLELPRPSPELAKHELLVDLAELAIVQRLAQLQPATQAMAAVAAAQQETLKESAELAGQESLLFATQFLR
jgi:hypothetical protein